VFFKEAQPEKQLEELSKFSKGEIDKPPNKPNFIPADDINARRENARKAKETVAKAKQEVRDAKKKVKKSEKK
jgi:hypothetical protein